MLENKTIKDCVVIPNFYAEDARGSFLKFFQCSKLPDHVRNLCFREGFVSCSRKNVLRGMHFQTPPHDLDKLVTVIQGNVLDVVLDMRKSSPSFGAWNTFYLGDSSGDRTLFVPSGCAHGFLSLAEETRMLYLTTEEFHPEHDTGIRFDTFGFDWGIPAADLILSEKDRNLPSWNPEESPFQ